MTSSDPSGSPPEHSIERSSRIAPAWGAVGALIGVVSLFGIMLCALGLSALWVWFKTGFSADEAALQAAAEEMQGDPIVMLLLIALQFGAFVAIPFLIAAASRAGWSALGLYAIDRRAVFECIGGAFFLLAISLTYGPVLRWIAPDYAEHFAQEIARQTEQLQFIGMPFFLLMVVIIAPVAEELFFRSLIFGGLRAVTGFHVASVSAALFFGIIHFMPASLPPLVMVGLVCAWFYERHGSVVSSILVHALFNGFTVALSKVGS